ncbi:uncharacterized protein EI97DRAFT_69842 [Westerdykella ornata]|uniref:Helicase C-terminal domain-containing protein n=1 Tax=Westerdykella ornata TaxID=318751 RepID=A0A6A6JLB1_WESOR|nr:uncharacterized protein EI97DRAFT_69842 [Westerdykella ornata]KAF2275699.1 hypothetical protein EI97DRAFT_69842 [Westerdykella ornata]
MGCFRDPSNLEFNVRDSSRLNDTTAEIMQYHAENTRPDTRTIVFAAWMRALDLMELRLQQEPEYANGTRRIFRIDGKNVPNQPDRYDILSQFERSPKGSVLLASTGCLQEGVNITCASHEVILALSWSPHNEIQATARAYRIGQKHDVLLVTMTSDCWIEAHVRGMRERKNMYEARVRDGYPHGNLHHPSTGPLWTQPLPT